MTAVWQSPGRVAFSIGGFEIMWYGVCIAVGILVGFYLIYKRAPLYHGIDGDRAFYMILFVLLAALVGLRVYYVAFTWDYYSVHPEEILNIRSGGLAIHGGLLFGIGMVFILSRVWKESFFNILDLFFTIIPLGQAIGRWGNFFNSEAHGTHTDLPWAILVDGDTVHPTFLYESIWCFIVFLILLRIDRKRRFVGQTVLLYFILYSIERYFVEGLRTDSLMIGDFRQAQLLSIGAIIFCAVLYIVFYRQQLAREKLATAGGGEAQADVPAATETAGATSVADEGEASAAVATESAGEEATATATETACGASAADATSATEAAGEAQTDGSKA